MQLVYLSKFFWNIILKFKTCNDWIKTNNSVLNFSCTDCFTDVDFVKISRWLFLRINFDQFWSVQHFDADFGISKYWYEHKTKPLCEIKFLRCTLGTVFLNVNVPSSQNVRKSIKEIPGSSFCFSFSRGFVLWIHLYRINHSWRVTVLSRFHDCG